MERRCINSCKQMEIFLAGAEKGAQDFSTVLQSAKFLFEEVPASREAVLEYLANTLKQIAVLYSRGQGQHYSTIVDECTSLFSNDQIIFCDESSALDFSCWVLWTVADMCFQCHQASPGHSGQENWPNRVYPIAVLWNKFQYVLSRVDTENSKTVSKVIQVFLNVTATYYPSMQWSFPQFQVLANTYSAGTLSQLLENALTTFSQVLATGSANNRHPSEKIIQKMAPVLELLKVKPDQDVAELVSVCQSFTDGLLKTAGPAQIYAIPCLLYLASSNLVVAEALARTLAESDGNDLKSLYTSIAPLKNRWNLPKSWIIDMILNCFRQWDGSSDVACSILLRLFDLAFPPAILANTIASYSQRNADTDRSVVDQLVDVVLNDQTTLTSIIDKLSTVESVDKSSLPPTVQTLTIDELSDSCSDGHAMEVAVRTILANVLSGLRADLHHMIAGHSLTVVRHWNRLVPLLCRQICSNSRCDRLKLLKYSLQSMVLTLCVCNDSGESVLLCVRYLLLHSANRIDLLTLFDILIEFEVRQSEIVYMEDALVSTLQQICRPPAYPDPLAGDQDDEDDLEIEDRVRFLDNLREFAELFIERNREWALNSPLRVLANCIGILNLTKLFSSESASLARSAVRLVACLVRFNGRLVGERKIDDSIELLDYPFVQNVLGQLLVYFDKLLLNQTDDPNELSASISVVTTQLLPAFVYINEECSQLFLQLLVTHWLRTGLGVGQTPTEDDDGSVSSVLFQENLSSYTNTASFMDAFRHSGRFKKSDDVRQIGYQACSQKQNLTSAMQLFIIIDVAHNLNGRSSKINIEQAAAHVIACSLMDYHRFLDATNLHWPLIDMRFHKDRMAPLNDAAEIQSSVDRDLAIWHEFRRTPLNWHLLLITCRHLSSVHVCLPLIGRLICVLQAHWLKQRQKTGPALFQPNARYLEETRSVIFILRQSQLLDSKSNPLARSEVVLPMFSGYQIARLLSDIYCWLQFSCYSDYSCVPEGQGRVLFENFRLMLNQTINSVGPLYRNFFSIDLPKTSGQSQSKKNGFDDTEAENNIDDEEVDNETLEWRQIVSDCRRSLADQPLVDGGFLAEIPPVLLGLTDAPPTSRSTKFDLPKSSNDLLLATLFDSQKQCTPQEWLS